MMKQKISMNHIPADKIYQCGYCDLQHLLFMSADYYNAGIYGWNCDIYVLWYAGERIAICTGYRNLKGKKIPYELIRQYDGEAKGIREADLPMEEIMYRLDYTLRDFLWELTGEAGW